MKEWRVRTHRVGGGGNGLRSLAVAQKTSPRGCQAADVYVSLSVVRGLLVLLLVVSKLVIVSLVCG